MVLQKLAPGWPWRLAVLTPLGVYGFVYPFGIGLLLLGWIPPEAGWVGGCLLAAQGLAMAAWCGLNYGAARGLVAALIIAVVAWALEAFGVTTGVPFGAYRYSDALGASLGPVPAAIPFAWIATVGAAFFTARDAGPPRLRMGALPVLLGAALATLQDAVLETIATRVQGYWTWTAPGAPYYGVPWANFATWFGASLILGAVLQALLRPAPGRPRRYAGLPPLLYAMSLLMFGLLNWSRGFVVPAALAIVLLPPVLWRLRACVSPRWAL
jgi:putative membrane protein